MLRESGGAEMSGLIFRFSAQQVFDRASGKLRERAAGAPLECRVYILHFADKRIVLSYFAH